MIIIQIYSISAVTGHVGNPHKRDSSHIAEGLSSPLDVRVN